MRKTERAKKEIRFIVYIFALIAAVALISKVFGIYQMHEINKKVTGLFLDALKISNSALEIKANIYKIHRDMKDVVLAESKDELLTLVEKVDKNEKKVYNDLLVIKKNIYKEYALKLQKQTETLFRDWKPIRDEMILLVKNDKIAEAVEITKNRGAKHILKLQNSLEKLYEYAHNQADYLKKRSDEEFNSFLFTSVLTVLSILFLFILIVYYTVKRISNYIYRDEHLRGVLSVIRDINQLIVREKNKEALIRESCDILVSKHVFESAWMVLYDDDKKVEYIYTTDKNQNSSIFQEKIKSGWMPYCINKTGNASYSFIEDTKNYCQDCPLKELYKDKSAFNIELKYEDRIFGYLTLRINKKYIAYSDEVGLLEEVAGDIGYALNNIEIEQTILDLKELYDNTINSLENLLFVKDKHFTFITCNRAFEKFIGKTKDEIIGKSDYDIVDKKTADFFRTHDKEIFKYKTAKSNYEWVTYPNGNKVYLLTTKSPLLNSDGEIIGVVGNSVDVTKQKESEEALIESQKHFKQLMKESPSVIEVYDLNGLQIDVNHAYELLWGFEASLTLHKFNLFKSKEVERTGLLEYIKRAYAGESVSVPLYEYNSTGDTEAGGKGRVRILNTRIYPLKDSLGEVKNIVITHEDVTDREKSLLELEQKKREFEAIVREAPNPIILHSQDGKIIMLNQAWIDASGYTLEEIPTVESFINKIYEDSAVKDSVLKHIESMYGITSRVDEGEFTFLNKNKQEVTWKFSSAPLGVIDGKTVIITSAVDITELKKKDELMMAQSRHAAMGEMIGMIAHQWRQPISIVSMIANNILLDAALGSFDASKAQSYSKDIIEQTQHLSKTIDDFRNFFKPDKSVSKIDLKNIMDEVFSIVKESLKNNSIKFNISYESKTQIEGYPRELMQVFVNIINNAKDALVFKKTKDAFIEVNIYEDEKYLNTKICNNGGEIPKEILFKIFDPYFTTKDEKTGTGLGLYMSKMIVEDHLHGVIDVANIQSGVCFTVRLPKNGGSDSAK